MSNQVIKDILQNPSILQRVTLTAFNKIDTDRSKTIEVDELQRLINQIAIEIGVPIPTKDEIQIVMEVIDKDGSGHIEFDEFNLLIKSILHSIVTEEI